MVYVQFYQKSAIDEDEIIEACGDRSVIILDGRNTLFTHHSISEAECKRRGYVAWRVFHGETFSRSSPIGSVRYV